MYRTNTEQQLTPEDLYEKQFGRLIQ